MAESEKSVKSVKTLKTVFALLPGLLALFFVLQGCIGGQQPAATPPAEVPTVVATATPAISTPLPTPWPSACRSACPDGTTVECGQECKIQIPNVCTVKKIHQTNQSVKNLVDARDAFKKYAGYLKEKGLSDENLAVEWEFTQAAYLGVFENSSYWAVLFHYYRADSSEGNSQVQVSEKGEVVNLVRCA